MHGVGLSTTQLNSGLVPHITRIPVSTVRIPSRDHQSSELKLSDFGDGIDSRSDPRSQIIGLILTVNLGIWGTVIFNSISSLRKVGYFSKLDEVCVSLRTPLSSTRLIRFTTTGPSWAAAHQTLGASSWRRKCQLVEVFVWDCRNCPRGRRFCSASWSIQVKDHFPRHLFLIICIWVKQRISLAVYCSMAFASPAAEEKDVLTVFLKMARDEM